MVLAIPVAKADPIRMKPYQTGEWSSLVKAANGAPLVIHFWGVTCPACVKEMPKWGAFLKRNPNAKVIFIQVDDVTPDMMQKMLSKAGLETANNYYVAAPFDERLRYEIDPKWHGETPTTIFVDKNGKTSRKTGLINFQKLPSLMGIGA
ncbi:MAG: TlpA family protein disulfide reductase [Polynucleobacter sp.]